MIGKNAGELRIPFARPDPQHQVVKAVIGFGYHHTGRSSLSADFDIPSSRSAKSTKASNPPGPHGRMPDPPPVEKSFS